MVLAIDINDVIRDNIWQFHHIYNKYVGTVDIEYEDVNSFNMMEVYPFNSEEELYRFKYEEYPYELYGRAECCDKNLPYMLNDWLEKTLRNLDEENIPHVIFFSPFEMGLTIQSTFAFLSGKGFRPREVYFPINSLTIYDRADIVITAQPSLIEECPEDKYVIKINKPYNKECESLYSFDSMMNVINDKDETIIKILENRINNEVNESGNGNERKLFKY